MNRVKSSDSIDGNIKFKQSFWMVIPRRDTVFGQSYMEEESYVLPSVNIGQLPRWQSSLNCTLREDAWLRKQRLRTREAHNCRPHWRTLVRWVPSRRNCQSMWLPCSCLNEWINSFRRRKRGRYSEMNENSSDEDSKRKGRGSSS